MTEITRIDMDTVMAAHRIALEYATQDESSLKDAVRDEATLHHIVETAMDCSTAEEEAAHVLWRIANWHPFVEGNKRTAWILFQYILGDRYVVSEGREAEFNDFVRRMSAGMHSEEDIIAFIESNSTYVFWTFLKYSVEGELGCYAEVHSELLKLLGA